MIIFYTIDPVLGCTGNTDTYRIFLGFCHLIIWGCIPPCGMLVFGLLTIKNIWQAKHRLRPEQIVHGQRNANLTRLHYHMMRMTLIQSLLLIITTVPFSVEYIYKSMPANTPKDALQQAIANLRSITLTYIAVAGPCISFYLFTLTSQLFRQTFLDIFRQRQFTAASTNTQIQLITIKS